MAIIFAMLSAICFGTALVTARAGLRSLDARSGASISIPAATIVLVLAAPFGLEVSGATVDALLWFALVGLFFPGVVTLMTFRSNETLGPTVTGAVSGTAPLFALIGAHVLLGERIPPEAPAAAAMVACGIALLSWRPGALTGKDPGVELLWPLGGAILRGLAQVGAKSALALWPNPFAAALVGYAVSSATVLGTRRLGRRLQRRVTRADLFWFGLTGTLNGCAVLLMYYALAKAPVSVVAPIVATYPLVAALVGAAALRGELVTPRMVIGALLLVSAILYLMISVTGP